jgi:putative two-component system hydrogenase maturation factor HypX/HoxX
LYGSEYWTYTLPKRVGKETAQQLTEQCQPVSVDYAKAIGLIDDIIIQDDFAPSNYSGYQEQITRIAERVATQDDLGALLDLKRRTREADEKIKPLQQYRLEELEEMNQNFWGEDPAYHVARKRFVRKLPCPGNLQCTPALKQVCGNGSLCGEALLSGTNRCAFATVDRAKRMAGASR